MLPVSPCTVLILCVKHDEGFERLFQPFDVDWPWDKAEN
jgi:hypothetical protein